MFKNIHKLSKDEIKIEFLQFLISYILNSLEATIQIHRFMQFAQQGNVKPVNFLSVQLSYTSYSMAKNKAISKVN